VTRAKEKLYLIAARARQLFGSTTINPPSRFIYDIPAEVVEYINFEEETHYDKDGIEMPF
jgi:DNA helicase-2/ATP-dependent DNA helicase PcrA